MFDHLSTIMNTDTPDVFGAKTRHKNTCMRLIYVRWNRLLIVVKKYGHVLMTYKIDGRGTAKKKKKNKHGHPFCIFENLTCNMN